MNTPIALNRTLSLPMMVLYGLGTTIGAGIYALIGEIAGVAGYFAPMSFLLASIMAGLTAISFAELCSRFPQAAGAALYVKQGFSSNRLSIIVGLLVILAGLVSAAALANGFVGYLNQFVNVDRTLSVILVVLLLGTIAIWGIAESAMLAAFITLIEIGGLLTIVVVGSDELATLSYRWPELIPSISAEHWTGIYLGTVLSFYAFIGFEDMVDVAEEVKSAKRTLPIAILLTLGITTFVYLLLMTTAILSIPPSELAASEAPLSYLYEFHTGEKANAIGVIGMFAIINGALIQIIMASRVLYGLSSRGQLPKCLAVLNHRNRTPVLATGVATGIVITLALIGNLSSLAEATSVIMLTIFSMVNLALWRVKRLDPIPDGAMVFPAWIPIIGFVVSFAFVLNEVLGLIGF